MDPFPLSGSAHGTSLRRLKYRDPINSKVFGLYLSMSTFSTNFEASPFSHVLLLLAHYKTPVT